MQAAEEDMNRLLDTFVGEVITHGRDLSFETMKTLWSQGKYSFIHYAYAEQRDSHCPEQMLNSRQHLQALFTTVLLRLTFPSPFSSLIRVNHPRTTVPVESLCPQTTDTPTTSVHQPSSIPENTSNDAAQEAVQSTTPGLQTNTIQSGQCPQFHNHNTARPSTYSFPPNQRHHDSDTRGTHQNITLDGEDPLDPDWTDEPTEHDDSGATERVPEERDYEGCHPFLKALKKRKVQQKVKNVHRKPRHVDYAPDLTSSQMGGSVQLRVTVPLEAQVGALYLVYCLYCTQATSPGTRIYVTPSALKALHALIKVMKGADIRDGGAIVRQLIADNAFVFGVVNVCKPHQLLLIQANDIGMETSRSRKHLRKSSTFLQEGMRRALMHLREVAPTGGLHSEFVEYQARLSDLFEGTRVEHQSSILPCNLGTAFEEYYADALNGITSSLQATSDKQLKEISKGKGEKATGPQTDDDAADAEFDCELEKELSDVLRPAVSKKQRKQRGGMDLEFDITGLSKAARAVVMLQAEKEQQRASVQRSWMTLLDDPDE